MRIEYLADHQDFLGELAALHFGEWSYLRPDESLAGRTERLRNCTGRTIPAVFVGVIDGELVGSAMFMPNDLPSHRHLTPWLAGVFVKPEHRGCGLAKLLIERVVAHAASQGFRDLYLCTIHDHSMYEKLGWTVIERPAYNGTPVALMVRHISEATSVA